MAKDENMQAEEEQKFPKSSDKTYSLVEIVKAPLTMIDKGPEDTIFSFPIVAIWEAILGLGVMLVLVLFSWLKDAPLEELANPLITTDPAKAPWYFMGLQEMLEHMHPTLAGIIIPAVVVLFLMAIPYLDNDRTGAGRWFTTQRGKRLTFWTTIYTLIVMPIFVLVDNEYPPRELLRGLDMPFISQALIPGGILALLAILPALVLWRNKKEPATTREVMIVLFTVVFVTAVVLTLTGFLFRGPGFELFPPWDMPNGYNPFDGL